MMQFLLQAGAAADAVNHRGVTALLIAADLPSTPDDRGARSVQARHVGFRQQRCGARGWLTSRRGWACVLFVLLVRCAGVARRARRADR